MSPFYFDASNSHADVFYVGPNGWLHFYNVNFTIGVRPVINLKATTTISSGNGTAQNPFIVDWKRYASGELYALFSHVFYYPT